MRMGKYKLWLARAALDCVFWILSAAFGAWVFMQSLDGVWFLAASAGSRYGWPGALFVFAILFFVLAGAAFFSFVFALRCFRVFTPWVANVSLKEAMALVEDGVK